VSLSGVGLEIAQSPVRRAIDDADPRLMQTNPGTRREAGALREWRLPHLVGRGGRATAQEWRRAAL